MNKKNVNSTLYLLFTNSINSEIYYKKNYFLKNIKIYLFFIFYIVLIILKGVRIKKYD